MATAILASCDPVLRTYAATNSDWFLRRAVVSAPCRCVAWDAELTVILFVRGSRSARADSIRMPSAITGLRPSQCNQLIRGAQICRARPELAFRRLFRRRIKTVQVIPRAGRALCYTTL